MAMFGIIGGLAAIAGPVLGGMLIEANLFELGWRVVF
jgi:MFS family permease